MAYGGPLLVCGLVFLAGCGFSTGPDLSPQPSATSSGGSCGTQSVIANGEGGELHFFLGDGGDPRTLAMPGSAALCVERKLWLACCSAGGCAWGGAVEAYDVPAAFAIVSGEASVGDVHLEYNGARTCAQIAPRTEVVRVRVLMGEHRDTFALTAAPVAALALVEGPRGARAALPGRIRAIVGATGTFDVDLLGPSGEVLYSNEGPDLEAAPGSSGFSFVARDARRAEWSALTMGSAELRLTRGGQTAVVAFEALDDAAAARGRLLVGDGRSQFDRVICSEESLIRVELFDAQGEPLRGGAARLRSADPAIASLVPHPEDADTLVLSCGIQGTTVLTATIGAAALSLTVDALAPIWD